MSNIAPFDPRRRRSSWRKRRPSPSRSSSFFGLGISGALVAVAVVGSALFYAHALTRSGFRVATSDLDLSCRSVSVTDGDTFRCGTVRVRMYGIDAPEREGHCRPGRQCVEGDPVASTRNLERLITGRKVACQSIDVDRYGRTVARCFAGELDLSCEQVSGGYALRRYGDLRC